MTVNQAKSIIANDEQFAIAAWA